MLGRRDSTLPESIKPPIDYNGGMSGVPEFGTDIPLGRFVRRLRTTPDASKRDAYRSAHFFGWPSPLSLIWATLYGLYGHFSGLICVCLARASWLAPNRRRLTLLEYPRGIATECDLNKCLSELQPILVLLGKPQDQVNTERYSVSVRATKPPEPLLAMQPS
jgi:hypothetical protein